MSSCSSRLYHLIPTADNPRPCLSSSSLGFIILLLSFAVSKRYVWNVASILGTIIAGLSTAMYAFLIRMGNARTTNHPYNRTHSPQPSLSINWPLQPTTPTPAASIFDNGEAPVETVQGRTPGPEEELTRQQMLGLLSRDNPARASFSSLSSTYRIDLPVPQRAPTTYQIDLPYGSAVPAGATVQKVGIAPGYRPHAPSKLAEFYGPDTGMSDAETMAGSAESTLMPGWAGVERTRSAPVPAATKARERSREDRAREIEMNRR